MKTYKLFSVIKPYLTIGVTVLCLATFNVNAVEDNSKNNEYSASKANHGQHSMKKRFKKLANKLELTKAQRQEVKQIFVKMKSTKKDSRGSMIDFRKQVKTLITASEFDEDKFKTLYVGVQGDLQILAMKKAKMRHALMQVLTPKQQDKFLSIRKQKAL